MIREFIKTIIDETAANRERLHQLAELSWNEHQTTRFIKEQLEKDGFICRTIPGMDTGCFVDVVANPGAPFLLLRSDIDALPIEDNHELPYCSLTKGVSHACGHDFHTAAGISALKIFRMFGENSRFNFRVLFQPAEEPIPGGAERIKNTCVLEDVDQLFAIHVEPGLPVGVISFAKGWVNVQSHRFELTLTGPGGHSARVNEENNLIKHMADFLSKACLQFPIEVDDEKASILAFTSINGGESYNILPREIKLGGTFRTTDRLQLNKFINFISDYRENVWARVNINSRWQLVSGAPPVSIREQDFDKMKKIYFDELQADVKFKSFRSLGGDDFGWYLVNHYGVLFRVGINSKYSKGLHLSGFDAGNEALETALLAVSAFMLNW